MCNFGRIRNSQPRPFKYTQWVNGRARAKDTGKPIFEGSQYRFGIHAYRTRYTLLRMEMPLKCEVVGKVKLYGKVVIFEDGFLAQYAEIVDHVSLAASTVGSSTL